MNTLWYLRIPCCSPILYITRSFAETIRFFRKSALNRTQANAGRGGELKRKDMSSAVWLLGLAVDTKNPDKEGAGLLVQVRITGETAYANCAA